MSYTLIDWYCDVNGGLTLSSFFGGKKMGRCVQLTIQTEEGVDYVQMSYDDARDFFKEAIKQINKTEKQYNETPPWWEELSRTKEAKCA